MASGTGFNGEDHVATEVDHAYDVEPRVNHNQDETPAIPFYRPLPASAPIHVKPTVRARRLSDLSMEAHGEFLPGVDHGEQVPVEITNDVPDGYVEFVYKVLAATNHFMEK